MIYDRHLPAQRYAVLRTPPVVGLPCPPVGEGELRAVGPGPGVAAWARNSQALLSLVEIHRHWVLIGWIMMLLRQLSYGIKTQFKATKLPY